MVPITEAKPTSAPHRTERLDPAVTDDGAGRAMIAPDFGLCLDILEKIALETSVERVSSAIAGNLIALGNFTLGHVLLHRDGTLQPAAFARRGEPAITDAAEIPRLSAAILRRAAEFLATRQAGADLGRGDGEGDMYLCQPLYKGDNAVGVLVLQEGTARSAMTSSDFALVHTLAPHLASALAAAMDFDELVEGNSRRRESEEQLQSARAALTRASQRSVMEGLAASIAHETNQPLLGIASSAAASLRWLRRPTPNIEEVVANIEDIKAAAARMEEIIRAVRALAKQVPPISGRIDIDDLISEVLRLTGPELALAGVLVTKHLAASGRTFAGDRTQLQQLVVNLIYNAIHAMASRPEDRRRLEITSWIVDDVAYVTIRDTGSGIPDEIADRIFEPFFTTRPEGMGIGLSISRTVAEQHGGSLAIRQTGPEGTEFLFTITDGPR